MIALLIAAAPYFDGFIYAEGMVDSIENRELAQSTADNKARAQISIRMEHLTAALMKKYSEVPGDGTDYDGQPCLKSLFGEFLNGVEIIHRWESNGRVYAKARLDLRGLSEYLSRAVKLRPLSRANMQRAVDHAYAHAT